MSSSDNSSALPIVNLKAFLYGTVEEQVAIATNVDNICKNSGFLIVESHGVQKEIIDDAWSLAKAFFDLPLEEKMMSKPADPACPRGYFPMASEALAKSLGVDTQPDMKESFGIGPLRAPKYEIPAKYFEFHYGENLWPDLPADFRLAQTRYFEAMTDLGNRVLRLFASALKLPSDFFVRFHTHPMCALRCLNYPESEGPLPRGQRGAGEHSDYGSITMLKSDPDVPGLEIKLPSGEWAKAPLVEDGFIINIGDMMARWTNDRWVSTLHRVIQPRETGGGPTRRQSMAFFHNTNFDAQIECIPTCLKSGEKPKYEPVLGGQYLVKRFTSAIK